MNFFDAAILGIIEGLTEFLPVSSTAHLILGAKVLGIEQTEFVKSFEIIIQLGAILAVVTLYFRSFFEIEIIKKLIAGFVPTAVMGLLLYKKVKEYLGDMSVILWALLLGGIFLIVFEYLHKKKKVVGSDEISIKQAVIIGFCQCFAFVPGVSRSAATIVGGMMQGINRGAIAEFSFLLAVPTMAAATGLDIIKNKDVLLSGGNFSLLLVGFAVSYVVAIFAIKGFISFVRRRDFTRFGFYRIAIAIIFFLSI